MGCTETSVTINPLCQTSRKSEDLTDGIQFYIACKGKGKSHPITGHQGPSRGSRGIALLILNFGVRRGWVVSVTPRPLCPQERPGTHCTEGWVDPRAGLDVCEKSRPYRDSIPEPSSTLYRLSYRAHSVTCACIKISGPRNKSKKTCK
jgi:hypothetical protein